MKRLVLCAALILGVTGCSATNLAEVLKAAGQDNASVCATITSVYGTGRLARTNIVNGSVTCTQEGLTVKQGQFTEDLLEIWAERPADLY